MAQLTDTTPGALSAVTLLGNDLVATVSGTTLTELTGRRITQLSVFENTFSIGLVGLDVSADHGRQRGGCLRIRRNAGMG